MVRAIGIIANCCLCDSYFVVIVDHVDLTDFKGKKKGALEDKYEELQFLPCPTCQELCHDVKFQEYYITSDECKLSFCKFVMFEDKQINLITKRKIIEEPIINDFEAYEDDSKEKNKIMKKREIVQESVDDGVPLYLDMSDDGQKPKWTLVWGVGPQKLELDTSRSGRIYKPFLKQFGIKQMIYIKETEKSKEDYMEMLDIVYCAWKNTSGNDQQQMITKLEQNKPCFANWKKIKQDVEKYVSKEEIKTGF